LRQHGPGEAGAALVTALLVTSLAAAAATVLLGRIDRWIERVAAARDKAQAREFARAGVDYARAILAADARRSSADSLDEDWARSLPPLRHEGSEVAGRIEDMQGRLNLNNLRRADGGIDEPALAAYRRLLALCGLPEELAAALTGWERPLDHLANLARIEGYTPSVVERLRPFVAVLPGPQPVNVNTAPAQVLSALQPGLALAAAQALVRTRQGLPFRDAAEFRERLPAKNLPAPLLPVATASGHFLIHVLVQTGASRGRVSALVHRPAAGGRPRILWQSVQ
jgi:general secretion pathway protein K